MGRMVEVPRWDDSPNCPLHPDARYLLDEGPMDREGQWYTLACLACVREPAPPEEYADRSFAAWNIPVDEARRATPELNESEDRS